MLDLRIRNDVGRLMCSNKHAYTKRKSVETAIHSLVVTVERALHIKEYALGVFVDISGAFNNVKTGAIMDRLEATNTHPAISFWIRNLLSCRHSEQGTASIVKGAHRGGVLSPLLWNLVVDDLVKRFERRAPKTTAYADDIGIFITGV